MNRLLLTATLLGLSSSGIFAQNYNPKFDQGLDITEFVQAATGDTSQQTCLPFPSLELQTAKIGSIATVILMDFWKSLKAGPGYLGGPYDPRVLYSKPFQDGLMRASLLGQHESQTAHALLVEWESVKTTRSGLLAEAGALNNRDSALYREGVAIDNAAAAFAKEKEALQAEIAQYNQQCAGQPVNTICTNWYNKLTAKVAEYNGRVAIHNQKVEVWRSNVQSLKNSVSSWLAKVQEWESIILYFIRKADSFLSGHPICLLQKENYELIQIGNPPTQAYLTHCEYACGTDGHWWGFLLGPAATPRPCPKVVIDGETPLKSIQRQSPDFAAKDLFK